MFYLVNEPYLLNITGFIVNFLSVYVVRENNVFIFIIFYQNIVISSTSEAILSFLSPPLRPRYIKTTNPVDS